MHEKFATHHTCSVKRLQGRRLQGLLDFFYIAVEKLFFFAAFASAQRS
jgi:hypothetical protein